MSHKILRSKFVWAAMATAALAATNFIFSFYLFKAHGDQLSAEWIYYISVSVWCNLGAFGGPFLILKELPNLVPSYKNELLIKFLSCIILCYFLGFVFLYFIFKFNFVYGYSGKFNFIFLLLGCGFHLTNTCIQISNACQDTLDRTINRSISLVGFILVLFILLFSTEFSFVYDILVFIILLLIYATLQIVSYIQMSFASGGKLKYRGFSSYLLEGSKIQLVTLVSFLFEPFLKLSFANTINSIELVTFDLLTKFSNGLRQILNGALRLLIAENAIQKTKNEYIYQSYCITLLIGNFVTIMLGFLAFKNFVLIFGVEIYINKLQMIMLATTASVSTMSIYMLNISTSYYMKNILSVLITSIAALILIYLLSESVANLYLIFCLALCLGSIGLSIGMKTTMYLYLFPQIIIIAQILLIYYEAGIAPLILGALLIALNFKWKKNVNFS